MWRVSLRRHVCFYALSFGVGMLRQAGRQAGRAGRGTLAGPGGRCAIVGRGAKLELDREREGGGGRQTDRQTD